MSDLYHNGLLVGSINLTEEWKSDMRLQNGLLRLTVGQAKITLRQFGHSVMVVSGEPKQLRCLPEVRLL
jgi:hypothetical protein